ncbi:hypothetical protein COLO4_06953 [Corchorus olitorius]|uniref:Uncharacterized protein n=1 Tax=Corchorus olitorius TaxID=93759 RepID=A0A1R3KLE2_9ROSI|nr:hypothetical protein COLO4_06953 [Corchorus olitorius]
MLNPLYPKPKDAYSDMNGLQIVFQLRRDTSQAERNEDSSIESVKERVHGKWSE